MTELREIDRKWAKKWDRTKIFEADIEDKEKIFATFPFPYMNGPLHLGHTFTSTRVDVWARFKRMQGYNTLFPWAWHITGEPIAGAAKRVAEGDESQIRIFRDIDEVPEEEIKKFTSPEYMARYYINDSKKSLIELGHSIDWRREFTTTSLNEQFDRFIEWQYLKLRDKGYVRKGTHPVVWCPHDESPTGDHDRLEGEGASPTEFIILKFEFGDAFLPAATLRPETIFGVTNMWINPDIEYVKINIAGEKWIVSREAVPKLKEQKDGVEIISSFMGRELIGKVCREPIKGRKIIILPAGFVMPDNATGVVMSVPSHAPYDYMALKDIQENPDEAEKYGITKESLMKIKPIPLIKTSKHGEHPAIELVEEMGIENQEDAKLEKATEIIYKQEFYKGVLRHITGKYSGLKVNEAKKQLVEDFIALHIADKMYELLENVKCRCGTTCVVKILKNQWFLNYSNEEWKAKVREALQDIKIYPPEARANFENTIEWLEDKACARKTGLGTLLPWDKEWKVETLSDSTIYMAFYTIAKHLNLEKIPGSKLEGDVFDYIFYGNGIIEELSSKYDINTELLEEMRNEFEYWMPVDLRCSAKELIPNHLTFFIFHHVALFDRSKWPRKIGVNGMMSIEGEKMSKSKGNFITLKKALRENGASVTRASLLYASEGMRDPDWRTRSAKDMEIHLRNLLEMIKDASSLDFRKERKNIDLWLESRLQRHIKNTTDNLEELRTRSALQSGLFDVWRDIKWYMRRDKPEKDMLFEAIEIWAKLFSPYVPALSEEIWEILGRNGFISLAKWPEYSENKINIKAETAEDMLSELLSDIENIIKVAGITPKKIFLYISPEWKWEVFEALSSMSKEKLKNAMKELMKRENLRKHGKEVSGLITYYTRKPERLRFIARIDERAMLKEAREFIEREARAEVEVYLSEDENIYDPAGKSRNAMPMKPAIYLE
ncbi:valine--tRNA ligase [archaeon BMS3Bbin15]|nr:valine--tRNA ligase [archaeon BMS3Bbin15]